MKVFAAVDVRDGAAVQLVGGRPDAERIRVPDPAAVARQWIDAGFDALHVVDLDAALGTGENRAAIRAIAATVAHRVLLQVGGGIRDEEAIDRTLALGADRVVVGTRGVEDRAWLEEVAAARPGRIVLAADVRGDQVMSRGWTEATGVDTASFLEGLDAVELAGVLVTDVDREGREAGVDTALFSRLMAATRHPLIAAGGIASAADLRDLRDTGAAGAILGMALYTGRIDPADALALANTGDDLSTLTRETGETRIRIGLTTGVEPDAVNGDPITTGDRFLDHMLTTLARYADLQLKIEGRGDMRHHLVEDTAVTLGTLLARETPPTSARYGHAVIPMDDALVQVAVDIGGRPHYEGRLPSRLYEHFFRSLALHAGWTLHVRVIRGRDRHHVVEAAFKALGMALRQARRDDGAVFSTKGTVHIAWEEENAR